jgi:hypothetical protein
MHGLSPGPQLHAAAALCRQPVQQGFFAMVSFARGCQAQQPRAESFAAEAGGCAALLLAASPKALTQLLGLPQAPAGVDTYKAAEDLQAAALQHLQCSLPARHITQAAAAAEAATTVHVAATDCSSSGSCQPRSFLDWYLAAHAVKSHSHSSSSSSSQEKQSASAAAAPPAGPAAAHGHKHNSHAGAGSSAALFDPSRRPSSLDESFAQLALLSSEVRRSLIFFFLK